MDKTYETFVLENKSTGNLKFFIDTRTFKPTQTTLSIISASLKSIRDGDELLDLGCGCGVVAIAIAKSNKKKLSLFASDISGTVEEIVSLNAKNHDVKIEVRKSDIFGAWEGFKFDTIINDISGVAEAVAKISPWFQNISCDTGSGGYKLISQVLRESPNFLKQDGKLIFPIISFSNEQKILEQANQIYGKVQLLRKDLWPAPKELKNNLDLLKKLRQEGHISFEEKFGSVIGYTSVYQASRPTNRNEMRENF